MIQKMNLKDNIILEGKVRDIVQYFYSSDAFILPSNYEGRAIVLVEAMACGLPVISTNVSGTSDVITQKRNGLIVPINNSKLLAENIIYFINNTEKMKEFGRQGKKFVKETN